MIAAFVHNTTTQVAVKKRTLHEVLLRGPPNNSSIKKFGYAAYPQVHKATSSLKLADHTQLGIYLQTRNGLFRIHLWRSNGIIQTKHATFDVKWYPRPETEEYVSLEEQRYDPREERTHTKRHAPDQVNKEDESGALNEYHDTVQPERHIANDVANEHRKSKTSCSAHFLQL